MAKLMNMPETASMQDIQRNYRKLFDRVKETRNPLFVLRNNVTEAVIIDADSWKSISLKLQDKEESDALEALKIYHKEKKAGKLKVLKGKFSSLMN